MNVKVIDTHCDFLGRVYFDNNVDFMKDGIADVSYPRLKAGNVTLQFFAMFMSDYSGIPTFDRILEYVDIFYRDIVSRDEVVFVRTKGDLEKAIAEGKLGALLSLEGVDGLHGNLMHLRTLYHLGLRALGITWNHSNWAADGVGDPRGAGFSLQGKQLVKECNRLGIILDVSHLSEQGFAELVELSSRPFIASHSNTRKHCGHRRNMTDEQIVQMVQLNGMMGITFVPPFVKDENAQIKDLLLHIDHMASLGGAKHIGFGSDFDGIGDNKIAGLENPSGYVNVFNELQKHYTETVVHDLMFNNWHRFLLANLNENN